MSVEAADFVPDPDLFYWDPINYRPGWEALVEDDEPKSLPDGRILLQHGSKREDASDDDVSVPLLAVCVDDARLDPKLLPDCLDPLVEEIVGMYAHDRCATYPSDRHHP